MGFFSLNPVLEYLKIDSIRFNIYHPKRAQNDWIVTIGREDVSHMSQDVKTTHYQRRPKQANDGCYRTSDFKRRLFLV